MKMNPAERHQALNSMPANHFARTMFILGLKTTAAAHDNMSQHQRDRLDRELLPALRRITALQQRTNMRGLLAGRIDQANQLFNDIMGDDWHPRPDNPIQRQCQTELLLEL